MKLKKEQREFRADPLKLKRLRVAAGMTVKDFAKQAQLDRGTAAKMLRRDPIFLRTLADAGAHAFGITNHLELLHPDELAQMGVVHTESNKQHVLEWNITEYLSPWMKTSNGLQYQLVKLEHRFLDGRFARGKRYELRHLSAPHRKLLEEQLRRHVSVCEQVGPHPNLAHNLTAAWIEGQWWVLDAWHEGTYLTQRLNEGPCTEYELKFIVTGLAEGLQALHRHDIFARELSPERVLIRERDDRPVIADLELAKLASTRSVSPDQWPDDPYRALEVIGETPVDGRADIYSLARIFVQAATGTLPAAGTENLNSISAPAKVTQLIGQSLNLARSKRPATIDPILAALKAWP